MKKEQITATEEEQRTVKKMSHEMQRYCFFFYIYNRQCKRNEAALEWYDILE